MTFLTLFCVSQIREPRWRTRFTVDSAGSSAAPKYGFCLSLAPSARPGRGLPDVQVLGVLGLSAVVAVLLLALLVLLLPQVGAHQLGELDVVVVLHEPGHAVCVCAEGLLKLLLPRFRRGDFSVDIFRKKCYSWIISNLVLVEV